MPDLDPARVEAAVGACPSWCDGDCHANAAAVLAADDARAREQGLVATGDGLTLDMLRPMFHHDDCDHYEGHCFVSAALSRLPANLRARLEGQDRG